MGNKLPKIVLASGGGVSTIRIGADNKKYPKSDMTNITIGEDAKEN